MKKVMVFGGASQLARCLKRLGKDAPELHFIFFSSKEVDVTDPRQLEISFMQHHPQVVVNCAAYTAVDQAEEEKEKAELINAKAPAAIAEFCKEYKALLIHISTDFVFEGNKAALLTEEDQTNPISVYGKTKLAGEKAVLEAWEMSVIVRTSWLYSEYGHNFVKTMLELGKQKKTIGVVADQIGTPTYAMDLAALIVKISKSSRFEYGIYHFSNEGVASWFDFAHAIFTLSEMKPALVPLTTAEFAAKAKRPAFSVLENRRVKRIFDITIPHWRDSLSICIKNINQSVSNE